MVDNGYCGDVEQDSVGSKAWKIHKQTNPILCPPVDSGSVEVSPPKIFNNTSNTAQHDIDKLASTIGELLETAVKLVDYDHFCIELLGVLRGFPLFVEEYKAAIDAALQDVQLCFREGILLSDSQRVEEVYHWMHDFSAMLSGDWLASQSNYQQLHRDAKTAIRPDRLPDIRHAIWQKRVRVVEICFLGTCLNASIDCAAVILILRVCPRAASLSSNSDRGGKQLTAVTEKALKHQRRGRSQFQ